MGFERDAVEELLNDAMSQRAAVAGRYIRMGKGEPFILRYLRKHGTATPTELARASHSSSGRISAVLTALEKKGFLVRAGSGDDRRSVTVSITAAGREQSQRDRDRMWAVTSWIFTQMGERRTWLFVDLVSEFFTYLSICDPDGPRPTRQEIDAAFDARRKRREA